MLISKENYPVTLINVFHTTPERQQALVEQWIRLAEAVKEEPGFIGVALHKSADGTRVINSAHWRSQEDWDSFVTKYREQFASFGPSLSRSIHISTKWSTSMNRQAGDQRA
jgi:heme-degrading monooxygenase HmoA